MPPSLPRSRSLRAAACAVLLAACRRGPGVHAGDAVRLSYELSSGGAVVETTFNDPPITVVQGRGDLPAAADAALLGMVPGAEKTVTLSADQAFGAYDPKRVETMPLSDLGDLGRGLKAGQKIMGFRDGKPETALVREVSGGTAVLDFNRPLAGKTVVYRLRVAAVDAP
jgi:FKBP-type peptidyl-prolyl cis-trans isomerase 2